MHSFQKTSSKIPRKIIKVKPTKYEGTQVLHSNKKYWKSIFREIDNPIKTMVSFEH